MAATTNKALRAVDDEYREALKEFRAADKRLKAAGEARTNAHRMEELRRSAAIRAMAGLSDAEIKALRQEISLTDPPSESLVNEQG